MASETHLLILRPRSAVTACGKHLVAIYPHTATAEPAGLEGHINYTILSLRWVIPPVLHGDGDARRDERQEQHDQDVLP